MADKVLQLLHQLGYPNLYVGEFFYAVQKGASRSAREVYRALQFMDYEELPDAIRTPRISAANRRNRYRSLSHKL